MVKRIYPPALVLALAAYVALYYAYALPASPLYQPINAKYWWNPVFMFTIVSFLSLTMMIPVAFIMAPFGLLGYRED